MEIIQQLRGSHWVDASERLRLVNLAADEIERLREELKFTDEVRHSAFQSLFAAEKEIERLRKDKTELMFDPSIKMLLAGKKALFRFVEDPTINDAMEIYMKMIAAYKESREVSDGHR